jgi:hypothetical protein
MSDLHIDINRRIPAIPKEAEYLALCGDIGDIMDDTYEKLINQVSNTFKEVFVILGNHEYYGHVIADVERRCVELQLRYTNVYFLDKRAVVVDGVRILGCTLWSDVKDHVKQRMNDYRLIFKNQNEVLEPLDVRKIHQEHVTWLKSEIGMSYRPTIVLTHHAADMRMNGRFLGGPNQSAFATDLMEMFVPPIKAWICGHTHQNMTLYINGIPHTANCLGYLNEVHNFDPCKTITISTT